MNDQDNIALTDSELKASSPYQWLARRFTPDVAKNILREHERRVLSKLRANGVQAGEPQCPRCELPLRQECNCDEGYAARAALASTTATCDHQFHFFGDQKERRCNWCSVLESKAARAPQRRVGLFDAAPLYPDVSAEDIKRRATIAANFLQDMSSAPVADTLPLEKALYELVDKIAPGLDTGDLVQDARRASAALDAIMASAPVALPAGYALVPVEPTPGMIEAGATERITPHASAGHGAVAAYKAMLAAAPQASEAVPLADCYSNNDGDSWLDCPDDIEFVHGLKVGDEYELKASIWAWPERFRVTKVPDDTSDDYEVEPISVRALKTQADKDGGDCAKGAGYAGVTVWVGSRQATQVVTKELLDLSNADELLCRFEAARAALAAQKQGTGYSAGYAAGYYNGHRDAVAAESAKRNAAPKEDA